MDCTPPGSFVHGILQARVLEWVGISFSRGGLPDPGIEPVSLMSPALAGGFLTTSTTWEVLTLWAGLKHEFERESYEEYEKPFESMVTKPAYQSWPVEFQLYVYIKAGQVSYNLEFKYSNSQ